MKIEFKFSGLRSKNNDCVRKLVQKKRNSSGEQRTNLFRYLDVKTEIINLRKYLRNEKLIH